MPVWDGKLAFEGFCKDPLAKRPVGANAGLVCDEPGPNWELPNMEDGGGPAGVVDG